MLPLTTLGQETRWALIFYSSRAHTGSCSITLYIFQDCTRTGGWPPYQSCFRRFLHCLSITWGSKEYFVHYHLHQCSVRVGMTRSCLYFTGCTGFVRHSEYLSSWQYWHFGVGGVLPRRIWVTACAMSPIFQVDNVCVLRHQRILLCHRHVFKQSVIERSVLRRQKPGTVFCQKWRHQWHCRHLNKNL